jgi:hypothetical protein
MTLTGIKTGMRLDIPKSTNNYIWNITQKAKDRATLTPLKPGGELGCSGWDISSCSTYDTRRTSSDVEIVLGTSIRK